MHYSRRARGSDLHAPQQQRLGLKARVLEAFRAAADPDSEDDAGAARAEAYAFRMARRYFRSIGWAPLTELTELAEHADTAEVIQPPSQGRSLRAIK